MASGVGAGAALERPGQDPVVAAEVVRDLAIQDPAPVSVPGTAGDGTSASLSAGISRGGLDATSDRQELPAEPAPVAVPAAPAPIDPLQVDAAGLAFVDREAGLLSLAVPTSGSGDLVVVPGAAPAPLTDRPVRTVRVEVEGGLEIDGALFAQLVMATLNDARGWSADGSVTFARTDGEADLRVVLASPDLVDELCAPLDTVGRFSCGTNGHAVLNHTRWVQATEEFSDRALYRQYLVNHEVGHLLGHPHEDCPADGAVAPLMQQQSVTVAPCTPNGWPFPDAA
ncbi:MAG: hypothetical protein JWP95_1561 [Actinotalea sp.]|nr:hypothetical protein [Actinotalea sp.]